MRPPGHSPGAFTELSGVSEFRRGLGPLIACIFGTSCGLLSITFYTQGIFVQPVTAEFGWDRGQFFLGYTLMMLT